MKGLVTPSDVRSKCKGGNDSHSSPMMGLMRTDFGTTAVTSFLAIDTQLPADAFSSWQFWGLLVGVSFLRWEIIPGGEYSEALASCANQPWKRTSSGFNFFYGGSNSWIGSAMSVLGPVSFTRVLVFVFSWSRLYWYKETDVYIFTFSCNGFIFSNFKCTLFSSW